MAGWHHRLTGRKFEQIPGHSEGQGSLACVHGVNKESDMTQRLNNKEAESKSEVAWSWGQERVLTASEHEGIFLRRDGNIPKL